MIHFAQEEEKDESKLKLCPRTFTVVEQQWTLRMNLDSTGPHSAPSWSAFLWGQRAHFF